MARQKRQFMRQGAADLPDRAAVNAYTGAPAEPIWDGETLRMQDGVTPGGIPLISSASIGSTIFQGGASSVSRSGADRVADRVNLLEFIPTNLQAGVLLRTSAAAIDDYMAAAIERCRLNGGGQVWIPRGKYLFDRQILLPDTNFSHGVILSGEGKTNTLLQLRTSLPTGQGFVERGKSNVVIGGGIRDIWLEAAGLADYVLKIPTGKGFITRSTICTNARVTEGLFGDATTPRFYEWATHDAWFYTSSGTITDPSLRPDYNVRLQGYATDSELWGIHAANAKLANIRIEAGGNAVFGAHCYGFPATYEADYCIKADAPCTRIIGNYCDGFTLGGIHVNASNITLSSNAYFWPQTTTGEGAVVANGLSKISILGNVYSNKPVDKLGVAFTGGQPADSLILENVTRGDGLRLLLGHTATLSALSNARLQIAGTTFSTANLGLGRWSADNQGPYITLHKSRGTGLGVLGLVAASDFLGIHDFAGDDGAVTRTGARIAAIVEGTPAAGSVAARLAFYTTPNGTASPVERLRIQNDGAILHRVGASQIFDVNSLPVVRAFTVATLPTPGVAGRLAKASNGRALTSTGALEAAGAGTGCIVEDTGSAWRVIGTNQTAVA